MDDCVVIDSIVAAGAVLPKILPSLRVQFGHQKKSTSINLILQERLVVSDITMYSSWFKEE
jgi:hypothetical protein